MDPTILVKMKRTDDLFSSNKVYVSKDKLFEILKFFNNMSEEEERTYGSAVIDYSEDSSGCKIQSDLSEQQFDSLMALLNCYGSNHE